MKIKYNNRLFFKILGVTAICLVTLFTQGLGQTVGQETVRVGLQLPLTGEISAFAPRAVNTYSFAIERINELGGVLGRRIEVFTEDDGDSPEQAIPAAQKLIAQRVKVIFGPSSNTILGILPLTRENKIPLFSQWAGSPTLDPTGGVKDLFFRTVPSDTVSDLAAVEEIMDNRGIKACSILVQNLESPQGEARAFKHYLEKKGGKVLNVVSFAPERTSYRSEVRKIFSDKPEAVFLASGHMDATKILRDWHAQGSPKTQWVFSIDLSPQEVLETIMPVKGSLEKAISSEPTEASGKVSEQFGRMFKNKFGKDPEAFTANCWDAFNIWALAVEAAGTSEGPAVAQKIFAVANPPGIKVSTFDAGRALIKAGIEINYEGAAGDQDFDENGNVAGPIKIIEVQNDTYVGIKVITP